MTRKYIMSDKLLSGRVPLSHGIKVGNLIFVSGMSPLDKYGNLKKGDFEGQMHQVMEKMIAVLEEAGSSLDKVAKVNVVMTDVSNFAKMNEIYATYFKEGNYPARITMETGLANPDFMLEIECVAEC